MSYSALFKSYRIRKGLSPTELAHQVKKTPGYIINLEKGHKKPPTFKLCQNIADVLSLNNDERQNLYLAAFEERIGDDINFLQNDIIGVSKLSPGYGTIKEKEIKSALRDPDAKEILLRFQKFDTKTKKVIADFIKKADDLDIEKLKAVLSLIGKN